MPLEYISHCKSYLEERSLLLEVSGHRRGLLDHHGQRQAEMKSISGRYTVCPRKVCRVRIGGKGVGLSII